jgi:hypothetical protein
LPGVLLIPLDFVPGALQVRNAVNDQDARAFELCILTCQALVTFSVSVAGRPCLQ